MVGEIPLINLPDWLQIAFIMATFVLLFAVLAQYFGIRRHPICGPVMEAESSNKRLAFIHFPSGQVELGVPKKVPDMGNIAPIWDINGSTRFKDITGEKWERLGNIAILHYTARNPVPLGSRQAVALDQLNDILAYHGFSTVGIKKEIFYMIAEAAKGPTAEAEAWRKLGIQSRETQTKIRNILEFLKKNPEIRFQLFKEGAFVYQTAVSVVDQITSDTIVETSGLISFVEDRMRRKLADRMGDMMKWFIIMIPIMVVAAISGVIFLVGTGAVKL